MRRSLVLVGAIVLPFSLGMLLLPLAGADLEKNLPGRTADPGALATLRAATPPPGVTWYPVLNASCAPTTACTYTSQACANLNAGDPCGTCTGPLKHECLPSEAEEQQGFHCRFWLDPLGCCALPNTCVTAGAGLVCEGSGAGNPRAGSLMACENY